MFYKIERRRLIETGCLIETGRLIETVRLIETGCLVIRENIDIIHSTGVLVFHSNKSRHDISMDPGAM